MMSAMNCLTCLFNTGSGGQIECKYKYCPFIKPEYIYKRGVPRCPYCGCGLEDLPKVCPKCGAELKRK